MLNDFIWRGEFILYVFFFKVHEKTFMSSNWFWFLTWFFGFLSRIKLSWFFKIFYGCFRVKIGFKVVFRVKKLKSWFSRHHSNYNLGRLIDELSIYFFKKFVGDILLSFSIIFLICAVLCNIFINLFYSINLIHVYISIIVCLKKIII